jgi:outer membrane protein insertion porin family
VGTSGGSIGFGIKENNYLGKGISLDSKFYISVKTLSKDFSA